VSTAGPATRPAPAPAAVAPFAAAPFLREIGRGKDGSRALPRERARELMDAILAGAVGDLALGGVLLALRMKGEAASEIAGFLDALDPHLARAPAAAPGWVILPSYNGARTHANLLPLLALLLARAGIPVLVHGQASEPVTAGRPRVTSAAIFAALGMAPCARIADAAGLAARGQPAVLALDSFAPALSRLIALRAVLGVRNVAHTLAKLVRPVAGPSLLVSSYTHPDFGRLQAELFAQTGALAMSLRGTDGEAVVSARRAQGVDLWRDGHCTTVISGEAVARGVGELPAPDAASTAAWIRDVLDGRQAVPASLVAQCAAIVAAVNATPPLPIGDTGGFLPGTIATAVMAAGGVSGRGAAPS
jgi:anthranilate phosphoribosyltransferase